MFRDMVEGQDAGSDLYLIKPVLATKLLSMVGLFLAAEVPLSRRRRPAAPTA
jgi:DNA-binding response OmpR family regulator